MKRRVRQLFVGSISALLIGITVFANSPAALALTTAERRHYAQLGVEFIDDPCVEGAGATGEPNKATNNNERDVFVRLVQLYGLTPEQAAGIVGNLRYESGVIPTRQEGKPPEYIATHPINGIGFGIAQWTYNSRQKPLVAFAEKQGKEVTDLFAQVDYLWYELNHGYKSVLEALRKTTNTHDAADVILQRFEIPKNRGPSVTAERAAAAQDVLDKNRKYLTGAAASGEDSGCSGQNSGTVSGANCESIGKKSEGGKDNPYLCDSGEVKCAAGTDMGTDMGYNRAKHFTIRKCKVHGIIVNAFISGNVNALINLAAEQGYKLDGGGFRTMQGQLDTRRKNGCSPHDNIGQPTNGYYPESALEANRSRTPPEVGGCRTLTATPGYSNHQMGLAIDFNCDGRLITSKSNRCFTWLSDPEHGAKYGLYDKISNVEPWHWSVTGG